MMNEIFFFFFFFFFFFSSVTPMMMSSVRSMVFALIAITALGSLFIQRAAFMVEMRPSAASSASSASHQSVGNVIRSGRDAAAMPERAETLFSDTHAESAQAKIDIFDVEDDNNGARQALDERWRKQQARMRDLLAGGDRKSIERGSDFIFGVDSGINQNRLDNRASSSPRTGPTSTSSSSSSSTTTTISTSSRSTSTTSSSTTTSRPQVFLSHVQFEHSLLQHFVPLPAPQLSAAQLKANPPRQLLVLSPGDSGQSMVARLLMMMGFYGGQMSEFYLQGADPNPKERWERKDVYKLNQLLLAAHQFDVDTYETAIGFALSSVSPANRSFFLSRLRRLLKQLAARRRSLGHQRAARLAARAPLHRRDERAALCARVSATRSVLPRRRSGAASRRGACSSGSPCGRSTPSRRCRRAPACRASSCATTSWCGSRRRPLRACAPIWRRSACAPRRR
jgi:hypothetical protein